MLTTYTDNFGSAYTIDFEGAGPFGHTWELQVPGVIELTSTNNKNINLTGLAVFSTGAFGFSDSNAVGVVTLSGGTATITNPHIEDSSRETIIMLSRHTLGTSPGHLAVSVNTGYPWASSATITSSDPNDDGEVTYIVIPNIA